MLLPVYKTHFNFVMMLFITFYVMSIPFVELLKKTLFG